ncbi:MAG: ATP-binding cassette domain-containing protein, partial [Actinomycetota bacterium]
VEDVLDLLGIAALRWRSLSTLSSGEAQRVAIGSVLTAGPRTLVLDEPTSALDPAAAEDVLAILLRLVDDLGLTVVVAEHRLERVAQYANRAARIDDTGRLRAGAPATVLADSAMAPPVIRLGTALGWSPPPVSVRDARRHAGALRDRLETCVPRPAPVPVPGEPVLRVAGVAARYGPREVLRSVDLEIGRGEIVAWMGRNGSGKSTLLGLLAGLRPPDAGSIAVLGAAPAALPPGERIRRVALVPSDPGWLLYERSVGAECATADREHGLPSGSTRTLLERITDGVPDDRHPRDLSEGQRLALALAVVCAPTPTLVLLDEPTRGLDLPAKNRLAATLRDLAAAGHTVVCATHDVELVAEVAHRAVVLADREVVADGPAREVVCHSPVFAPQIAKVVAPLAWLTVTEVLEATA